VANVRLVIADPQGAIYEQGEAEKADGLWWEYTSTAKLSTEATPVVTATVQDLPGNTDQMTWQNN